MRNIIFLVIGIINIIVSGYLFINIDKIRFKPWTDKCLSHDSKIKLFKGLLILIIVGSILGISYSLSLIIQYKEF